MSERILISFGRPRMGELLLRLAHLLRPQAEVQAIHFSPDPTVPREEAAYNTAESFDRLKTVADELKTQVRFVYREAANITDAIVRHTEAFQPQYLFLGAAGLFASDEPLSGRVGDVLSRIRCHAGVVLDRGLDRYEQFIILRNAEKGDRISELFGDLPERAGVEIVQNLTDHTIVGGERIVAVLTSDQLELLPDGSSALILHFSQND